MKTSIVIAEHSQPLINLQGQKAEPLCMVLNQMLQERATARGVAQGLSIYLLGSNRPNEQQLKEGLAVLG